MVLNLNLSNYHVFFDPYAFEFNAYTTPLSDIRVILSALVIYWGVLFVLSHYMENRSALSLNYVTRVHNFILFVWSFIMFVGTAWGVYLKINNTGPYSLFCEIGRGETKGPLIYFSYIYFISKYYELFDTVIMVLKKKPLTLLHVWHHSIILPLSWSWLVGVWTISWWGIFANTLVHIFMYYYYMVATMGYSPWWKKYLTTGQIVQFFSVFLFIFAFMYESYGNFSLKFGDKIHLDYTQKCSGDLWVVAFSQAVNITFLYLFISFYRSSYTSARPRNTHQS
eukprot:TRINITY_DN8078_c0_g1_i1.p1 TRINITY_DN8078_c0_g1~~TRINITY_DN8078_c0_g1_i1.p1  ORF type:complete len:294 (-),score=23.79 TRINITY_DN8078_c0_g1_i1:5-847(-)